MLNIFAKRLSSKMAESKIINYEEQSYYAYGLEILISNGLLFASILFIAVIIQHTLISIYFIALFAVLRLTLGGYHCEKYSHCYVVSMGIYVLFISSYIFINLLQYKYEIIVVSLLTLSFVSYFINLILVNSLKSNYLFSYKNMLFIGYLMGGIITLLLGFNTAAFPIAYTMLVTVALLIIKNYKEVKQR